MNSLWALWGLGSWKPLVTALLLPPVPGLLAIVAGAWLLCRHRRAGSLCIGAGTAFIWLSTCGVAAAWLEKHLLDVPLPLSPTRIEALRSASGQAGAPDTTAIVVLGGGRQRVAPEYGGPNLEWASLERLQYGLWLARATGFPVAFSGGIGWSQHDGAPEAEVAATIARRDFAVPLRWIEDGSRDTRGNAERSVRLLLDAGVRHVLLVTHGWHMPRAARAFEAAAAGRVRIEAAPMGLAPVDDERILDWLPTSKAATRTHQVLREWIGLRAGA